MKKRKKIIVIGIVIICLIIAIIYIIDYHMTKNRCCSCCGPESETCIEMCCPCKGIIPRKKNVK